MKKILIITDAWEPQVNGVVTTMTTVVKKLKEKNFKVEVIHPGMFHTFPLPNYPEISVAWNFWDLKKKIEKFDADYMHIQLRGRLVLQADTIAWKTTYLIPLAFIRSFPNMFMRDLVLA